MKSQRFLLGLFLLSVGFVLFLQRLDLIPFFSLGETLAKYWPVILIGIGFYLACNRGNAIIIVIMSLFVLLLLGAGLAWLENSGGDWNNYNRGRDEVIIPRQIGFCPYPVTKIV